VQVRVLATAALALASSCGGPQPTPQVPRDPRCAGFELDVQRIWNSEAQAEIQSSFGGTGLAYAKRMSESVITRMDDATRDWVMLKENLCTDCLVRGLIPKEIYAARSSCYDSALIRQRTAISLFKSADAAMVEKALDVFTDVSDRLKSCEREAMYTVYGDDAASANPDAVRRAEEKTAEASVALALGKKDEASRAAEEGQKVAEEANSRRLVAEALLQEGLAAREYARYDDAEAKLGQAMGISTQIADRVGEADALVGLGWVKWDWGKSRDALDLYDRAEALYTAALDPEAVQLGGLARHRGKAWQLLGEYRKALGFY
jgi:tetratricopeptide (TPR) repeat protein